MSLVPSFFSGSNIFEEMKTIRRSRDRKSHAGHVAAKRQQVRTDHDKEMRAAADRYKRAMSEQLDGDHRWMLRSSSSFQDIQDASKLRHFALDSGIPALQVRVAAFAAVPGHALVDDAGAMGCFRSVPDLALYLRMCELETLRMYCSNSVAVLYQELNQRNFWTFREEL